MFLPSVNKGRQGFLENSPDNFSRIVHDYSDERGGIYIMERLTRRKIDIGTRDIKTPCFGRMIVCSLI